MKWTIVKKLGGTVLEWHAASHIIQRVYRPNGARAGSTPSYLLNGSDEYARLSEAKATAEKKEKTT
jgi:hypothetical protein